jgi:hypothetical protein
MNNLRIHWTIEVCSGVLRGARLPLNAGTTLISADVEADVVVVDMNIDDNVSLEIDDAGRLQWSRFSSCDGESDEGDSVESIELIVGGVSLKFLVIVEPVKVVEPLIKVVDQQAQGEGRLEHDLVNESPAHVGEVLPLNSWMKRFQIPAAMFALAVGAGSLSYTVVSGQDAEGPDSAWLNTISTQYGAKNLKIDRAPNGQARLGATFASADQRNQFSTWLEARMPGKYVVDAVVASSGEFAGSAATVTPISATKITPKIDNLDAISRKLGCEQRCFDPASVQAVIAGDRARVYMRDGRVLMIGSILQEGVEVTSIEIDYIVLSKGDIDATVRFKL